MRHEYVRILFNVVKSKFCITIWAILLFHFHMKFSAQHIYLPNQK